jgi:hypothetical protein
MKMHALECAGPQIDLSASIASGEVVVGLGANGARIGVICDRHGVIPYTVQPIHNIFAAITPGGAWRRANTQMNLSTSEKEVLSDLTTGLSTSDNKDGPLRE